MNKETRINIKLPFIDKVLIALASVIMVGILGMSYVAIGQYKEDRVQYIYDSLNESGTNKEHYLSDQLQFNLNLVQALTTFSDIYEMDREAQANFFTSRAAILGYGQFFVVDNDGISYYFNENVEKDQSGEPFFELISSNETYITEPFYTEYGPILTLCSAIRNEKGIRVGTLCATFNISNIQKIIQDSTTSMTFKAFIVNSYGEYVAVDTLDEGTVQKNIFNYEENELSVIQEVFDKHVTKNGIIVIDGIEYYASAIYMDLAGWCLVECTETASLLEHIRMIEIFEILFTTIMFLLGFVIVHIINAWSKNFRQIHTDPLCGCGSRAACLEKLDELDKAHDAKAGILYMDLNNFKTVNDTFGHEKGDEILIIFAQVIMENFNSLGFVGRIGGDEFVAIFRNPNRIKIDGAIRKVERDLEIRSKKLSFDYNITASFGYTECSGGSSKNVNDALRKADSLMYEDKQARKNKE